MFAGQGITLSPVFQVYVLDVADPDGPVRTVEVPDESTDDPEDTIHDRRRPRSTDRHPVPRPRHLRRATYIVDFNGGVLTVSRPALVSADAAGVALGVNVGSSAGVGIQVAAAVADNKVHNAVTARDRRQWEHRPGLVRHRCLGRDDVDRRGHLRCDDRCARARPRRRCVRRQLGGGQLRGRRICDPQRHLQHRAAEIANSAVDAGGAITVRAVDDSTIRSDAGAAAFAIGGGGSGGVSAAVGTAISANEIHNSSGHR